MGRCCNLMHAFVQPAVYLNQFVQCILSKLLSLALLPACLFFSLLRCVRLCTSVAEIGIEYLSTYAGFERRGVSICDIPYFSWLVKVCCLFVVLSFGCFVVIFSVMLCPWCNFCHVVVVVDTVVATAILGDKMKISTNT